MPDKRDMVFVSHANPEDNEFSLWLTLQLAKQGYPVWCDLTKLLGGEDFWRDIEAAIRSRTIRFLYVLSRTSNTKPGPREELAVARKVARELPGFIIPLKIDDLKYDDTNIELQRLVALDFSLSWASGLNDLLKNLRADAIPKKDSFGPGAVARWWSTHFGSDDGVAERPESYLSNWYEIRGIPKLQRHVVQGNAAVLRKDSQPPFPLYPHEEAVFSFAPAQDLESFFSGRGLGITRTSAHDALEALSGNVAWLPARDAKTVLIYLLRSAWEGEMLRRGLQAYELASGKRCFWVPSGLIPRDKVEFVGVSGKKTDRQLVGKVMGTHWHFAIEPRPLFEPFPGFALKTHVVFSEDGATPIDSASRQHSARRSVCKNWWNPHWRDRVTALVTFLSENTRDAILLRVGRDTAICVSANPMQFESPVSYSVLDTQRPDPMVEDDEGENGFETPDETADSDT